MDEQRTPEWFAARMGKVTASRIADVTAKTKAGYGASRKTYMMELVSEILTGEPAKTFSNAAMEWGTETEPRAIASYEFLTDRDVVAVGFIPHPIIEQSGASPDGLVGDDGLIEVKCPNTTTHVEFLRGGSIPRKYMYQMQWQMACTGREWCDFVSFDPRIRIVESQTFIERIERDAETIEELEQEVRGFITDMYAILYSLPGYTAEAA